MRVQIYYNSHKKCWSVRSKETRKVIDHATTAVLSHARFRVSEAGRQRVIRTGTKNVHAWVEGDWMKGGIEIGGLVPVTYNPRKQKTFETRGIPIDEAQFVIFTKHGVLASAI